MTDDKQNITKQEDDDSESKYGEAQNGGDNDLVIDHVSFII